MTADAIYLDCNATTPILPEVAEAMRDAALKYPGNPASQHDAGRQARRVLEAARQRVGELLGCKTAGLDADRVIFTSGGTESNNLALIGLTKVQPRALPGGKREGTAPTSDYPRAEPGAENRGRIVISAIEHPSVTRAAERLATLGWRIDRLGVDANGVVRLDQAAELLDREPASVLVSLMLANNETGVVQPVAEIARLSRKRGALVHTDATQGLGKIAVDFQALGVDALTCTAHKLHGPLGIGALVVRRGVALDPQQFGGFQQAAMRPGTESVTLAVGFVTALEAWYRESAKREQRLTALRDELERSILTSCPFAVVVGAAASRLPHTSNIAFVGVDRQALAMALDLVGVACSTGSACASGSSEPSPTLLAMDLPEKQIRGSIRFSLGALTTADEVAEATRRISMTVNRLRGE